VICGEDINNSQGEVALEDPSSSKTPERTCSAHGMADIGGLVRMVENSLVKVFAISMVKVPDGGYIFLTELFFYWVLKTKHDLFFARYSHISTDPTERRAALHYRGAVS